MSNDQTLCLRPWPLGVERVHADGAAEPAEDEATLWTRWQRECDPAARSALLTRHLPYAKVIAAMVFARRSTDEVAFDDCLQFARLGLLEAFDRYDLSGGASFRTFAAPRMRGAVLDGIATLSERQQQIQLRRRLLRERTRLLLPDSGDSTVRRQSATSDDAFGSLAEVGVGLAIGFMLEDTAMFDDGSVCGADAVYRSIALRQMGGRLVRHIDDLPDELGRVVRLHYLQGHSFDQIAGDLGLSRSRISQLHRMALQSLRARLGEGARCDVDC